MQELLIITNHNYGSLDYLINGLEEQRICYKILKLNEFPIKLFGTLNIGSDVGWLLRNNDCQINSSKIGAVFFQGFDIPEVDKKIEEQKIKKYIISECETFIEGIFTTSNCYWLNNPTASKIAENKPQQLYLASKLGFNIPESLITNDPKEATRFYRANKGKIVIKPLNVNIIGTGNNRKAMLTRLVENETFEGLEYSPCFFQRYVDKRIELRIFVVRNQVFAVSIPSQERDITTIDWRRDTMGIKLSHYNLNGELTERCRELTKTMNLQYGAIDMIIDRENKPYFLEINPTGEWAWFEAKTGIEIRKALIKRLTEYL